MKNKVKLTSLGLAGVLALSLTGVFAGCKNNGGKYDPETDAVTMSLQGCDGVFNPFFASSEYDSEVVGMTQISMLNSDSEGNVSYGDDEAVVTKDFTTVMYDANGGVVTDGDQAKFTEFSFLIKKGIKFSDGVDLTIKDVLFSLYVYLDPVYTGSTTIYSTDIVGLAAYRTQNPEADENASEQLEVTFSAQAAQRIQRIYDYCQNMINDATGDSHLNTPFTDTEKTEIEEDIKTASEYFNEELGEVYQSAAEGLEDTMKEYTYIDEEYQAFFLSEGLITLLDRNNDGNVDKDASGKYMVDEESAESLCALVDDYAEKNYSEFEGATDADKKLAAKKSYAIELVSGEYFGDPYNWSGIQEIVSYRDTAVKLTTQFTAEAKSDYLQSGAGRVPNVSGITTEKVTTFNGKTLDGEYDVLKIRINGVDPKAKWNFGFNVSPLHYYSTTDYKGVNYVEAFNGVDNFGIKFGDKEFMDAVVNSVDKNGVPVGAGPYKASRDTGTEGMTGYVTATEFRKNNIIYFERNPYFETLGGSIHNANIKYLRYQVINSNQVFNSLKQGSIDFGELTAKQSVINELNGIDSLSYSLTKSNGYGYVGVNPKYVPDVLVRRAIMMAMDPTLITSNYYTNGLAEIIYRPMTKVSWAYPDDATAYYQYDNSGDAILAMLTADNKYEQRNAGTDDVQIGKVVNGKFTQLKYTFTIAGSSEDHPAWSMFRKAEEILESIGFDITVKTDAWALSKLSSGLLTVWAAAWSSTIDPDMYQVYHKDSTATSTLNWGYDVIKANINNVYDFEKGIVEELSNIIDLARETENQPRREAYYSEALDLVMELAIELPLYQRNDLMAFNSDKIDRASLTPESELSPYNSLLSRIWEMDFVD